MIENGENVIIGRYVLGERASLMDFFSSMTPRTSIVEMYHSMESSDKVDFYSNAVGGDVRINRSGNTLEIVYRSKFLSQALSADGAKALKKIADSHFVRVDSSRRLE